MRGQGAGWERGESRTSKIGFRNDTDESRKIWHRESAVLEFLGSYKKKLVLFMSTVGDIYLEARDRVSGILELGFRKNTSEILKH